jgi:hypothetical protein
MVNPEKYAAKVRKISLERQKKYLTLKDEVFFVQIKVLLVDQHKFPGSDIFTGGKLVKIHAAFYPVSLLIGCIPGFEVLSGSNLFAAFNVNQPSQFIKNFKQHIS